MSSPVAQIISTSTPTTYDVFISFRGEDTRTGFTSHLYNTLVTKGIRTFMDDSELRSGEVISDALRHAIQKSKIYVIVLSQDYASSTWCLDELIDILKYYKEFGRLVLPIFYKIEPFVVRFQLKSFDTAFQKHQIRFAGQTNKVNEWRNTLTKLAGFSGHVVSGERHTRSEADITNDVADRILFELKPTALEVAAIPVGLESRIKGITSLLNTSGVTMIGIWGMGGIGKTTLAKAVFNEISPNFAGRSFLANVREVSGAPKGLVSLQQQLIDEVMKKRIYTVHSVSQGIATIKERICSIKILIIIDDLDNLKQFQSLVGPFLSGSVIIITTRKEDLLVTIGVEPRYRYPVGELSKAESRHLFNQHAFGDQMPSHSFIYLSKKILQHAGGLPLALTIFGSNLRNQSEAEWKRVIGQFQDSLNPDILEKLKISFHTLVEPSLQEMFLDIACFFVGHNRKDVVPILGSCYRDVDANIDRLKSRCLIKFNEDNCFLMHDLVRDMGWEIARQNSPKDEPEKHSRLSDWDDICNVLENNKGTEGIKGIVHHYSFFRQLKVTFSTDTFKRMPKLRFLKIMDVTLAGSFEQTFEDLRWLHWSRCPLKSLPSDFFPKKLVILELSRSKIRTWEQTKDFKNLKTLDLSHADELITSPDFSRLPNLVTVNLSWCTKLENLDPTIGNLVNLVSLDLENCRFLESLPDSVCKLRALQCLNIGYCSYLQALPEELGNIKSLIKIKANALCIQKIPDSVGRLRKLVELRLESSWIISTLPDMCNMSSLEILDITECTGLEKLKPSDITQYSDLNLPPNLKQLKANGCTSDLRLLSLPNMKNLEILNLRDCNGLKHIKGFEELISIRELVLCGCSSMERLPSLSNFKHLQRLDIRHCSSLREIEGSEELTSITSLKLQGCYSSMVANILTKSLFQRYLEFGNTIEIHVGKEDIPNWINHSSGGCTEVQINVSQQFAGLLLSLPCYGHLRNSQISHECIYTINNTRSHMTCHSNERYVDNEGAMMVVVPRQELVESSEGYDGDTTFKVTALCTEHRQEGFNIGVYPLYKLPRI